jgi:hypothetical protein
MNWIPMLTWWQWLIMASIGPLIVLLYFLKLRRQPVEVPSTYLWQRAIEDLHVNSIWQRLRKNLLLLLQLLAVALFMLALLRPGMSSSSALGKRSIFLIDNSASMQATDVPGSRLRQAKDRVLEMIEAMESGDAAMVIAFSNSADVRQGFTVDRRRLREAVESIQPTNRITDLSEALRAAAGLANPGRTSQVQDLADIQVAEAQPATIYVISDGGFAPPEFQLGNLTPHYLPIGNEVVDNVAIVAFTAERNSEKPDQVEAFARIKNFGSAAVTVTASLTLDEQLADAKLVQLEPGGERGVPFELADVETGSLKLELDRSDDLLLDNVAFAGLDPPRQLQVVLVTEGNAALQTALSTQQAATVASIFLMDPATLGTPEAKQLAQGGKVDLFIYDRCAPDGMPLSNTLFLGGIPPGETWQLGPPVSPVFIIDTNRAHPILQYVDLGSVKIVEGQALQPPEGATSLIRSDGGVLMAVAPRGPYQDAVLGIALTKQGEGGPVPNTDWPIKRSFPVFLLNCLEYLGGSVSTAGSKTLLPGDPATLALASRHERVSVTEPGGGKVTLDRSGQPQLVYSRTETPGFYKVTEPESERVLQLFTVNLFQERESALATARDVQLGDTVVAATQAQQMFRQEYWRWLLLVALVVLTVEWILYTRRVAI